MPGHKKQHRTTSAQTQATRTGAPWPGFLLVVAVLALVGVILYLFIPRSTPTSNPSPSSPAGTASEAPEITGWVGRAQAVSKLFHRVYTPCWEGAYGAMGDAYLFAATRDSSLLRFHVVEHPLQNMCSGRWVDDVAWVCLAELKWWEMTGKTLQPLLLDAARRYQEVRDQGRLSNHEGFWAWYNWPPGSRVEAQIFTNSNMNQMATVACELYQATGERNYLHDALLVWEGERSVPGIRQTWYKGNGIWEGRHGLAAFGKELPWDGLGCSSIAAALYRATHRKEFKDIAVATARHLLDPSTGWVDPVDFYQIHMDGNGAFVNFLFDDYAIAPDELREIPGKVERMLNHVWTNHGGTATVTLHRTSDHGIRNGWNPLGGEDGYGVGEVGTVHAQGEAARAFGVFVYFTQHSGSRPIH